ncbi:hypothetical protein L6261_02135 [Candidatus Parcubacteria bacterium]|nr:hypothetical protein [Candidatus Parcubacteria bacterium]
MKIIPAIIPKSLEDLREKISLVKDQDISFVQVDITDGIFVPSKSWPFNDSTWNSGIHFEIPFCKEINIELDLMVKTPEEKISDWLDMGVKRIIIHVESTEKFDEIIDKLKGKVEIGIAFNIDTPFEPYINLLEKIDFIQLMGIEKIGFQGELFSEKIFDKIKNLRNTKSDVIISVDGGVNLENAPRLIETGVNRLVVGSAIFESGDIKGTTKQFKKLS